MQTYEAGLQFCFWYEGNKISHGTEHRHHWMWSFLTKLRFPVWLTVFTDDFISPHRRAKGKEIHWIHIHQVHIISYFEFLAINSHQLGKLFYSYNLRLNLHRIYDVLLPALLKSKLNAESVFSCEKIDYSMSLKLKWNCKSRKLIFGSHHNRKWPIF